MLREKGECDVSPEIDRQDGGNVFARLPDRLRLMRYDVAALATDLALLTKAEWVAHFVTANYHGDWSILPLRAPAGATHPILRAVAHPGITDWEDTELLDLCPAFASVLGTLQCPLEAVRLMRLAPGSEIRRHNDPDLDADHGTARLHIPIATNSGVEFLVNDRRVDMAPGELWYLRLSDPHQVFNRGTTERIHLVIDVRVNPWLEERLRIAASAGITA